MPPSASMEKGGKLRSVVVDVGVELIAVGCKRTKKSTEQLINSLLASADSEAFREPVDWRSLGLLDYPTIIKRPMDLGTVKLRLERGAYETAEACAADVRLIWENCKTYNSGGEPRKLHKAADNLSKRFEARFAKIPAGERLKPTPGGGDGGHGKGRGCGGRGGAKGGGHAGPPPPTSEDRRRLARQLGRARMEHVTAVVHEIDRRCPEALILRQAGQGQGSVGAEAVGVDDDGASGGGGGGGGGGRGGDGGVRDVAAIMSGTAAIEIEVDVDALDAWTFCAVERVVAPLAAQRRSASSTATARKRPAKRKKPAPAAAIPPAAPAASAVTVAAASSPRCSSGESSGGKESRSGTAGDDRQDPAHHQQEGAAATEAATGEAEVRPDDGKGVAEDARGVAEGAGAEAEEGEGRPCNKVKAAVGLGELAIVTKRADDQAGEELLSRPTQTVDRNLKVDEA